MAGTGTIGTAIFAPHERSLRTANMTAAFIVGALLPRAGSWVGAVVGVLQTVLQMVETGATHVGVATDHVIESFRNELWSGYKTGDGIEPALVAQFHPLEDALVAMGVVVWPMVEQEADDGLAAAAAMASADADVEQVRIHTVDKDLAQCVRDNRVVQVNVRKKLGKDFIRTRRGQGYVVDE